MRMTALAVLAAPLLVASVPMPTPPVTVQTVAKGLDHPWSVAFLPDGRVLVTERAGRLRVIAGGKLQAAPVAGVPKVYVESQGGLFDVTAHPKFAENGLIYLSYAAGTPGANATRIARAKLEGGRLTGLKVIFEVSPKKDTPVHFGARMAWLPDGTLAMTTGDGFEYREKAQDRAGLLGKVIRIRDDGTIPADNPFPGSAIWSLGHRNPQGLAFDAASGRLYEHEHGPRGGDEVNIIEKGANYGWPVATKGRDYSGAAISPFKTYRGMRDGIVVWVPSIAPSGLAVVSGPMFPEWRGDLLVGALVNEEVRRIDMVNGRPGAQSNAFPQIKARIRDVRVAPDGAIWVTTDEESGRVIRVSR
jgi:glucose/arabinose dehydrogenase